VLSEILKDAATSLDDDQVSLIVGYMLKFLCIQFMFFNSLAGNYSHRKTSRSLFVAFSWEQGWIV